MIRAPSAGGPWVGWIRAAAVLLVCGFVGTGRGEVWHGYFKLEGVLGEATDAQHKDWMVVTAFEQSAFLAVSRSGGGAGKASMGPLRLTKPLDRASPKLALNCATGRRLASGELDLVRHGQRGEPIELLVVKLEGVQVTQSQVGADGGEHPEETIQLVGNVVSMTYVELGVAGTAVRDHEFTWDAKTGKASYQSKSHGTGPGPGGELLERNLLQNPGAESGEGVADQASQLAPPGWELEGSFTAARYGGVFPSLPGDEFGVNFFVGGAGDSTSKGWQVVSVEALAARIDAGQILAKLSGWLGGRGPDSAEALASFLDKDGAKLGRVRIGPVNGKGRDEGPGLVEKNERVQVPPGTRSVEVAVVLNNLGGGYNEGYADNLALWLEEGSARPPELPVKVGRGKSSTPGVGDVLKISWPEGLQGVVVESSDALGSEWTPEQPEVRLENGERVLELPLDSERSRRFWRLRDVR